MKENAAEDDRCLAMAEEAIEASQARCSIIMNIRRLVETMMMLMIAVDQ